MKRHIQLLMVILLIFGATQHTKYYAYATESNPLFYENMLGQIPFETLQMYIPEEYRSNQFIYVNISGSPTKLYFNTELWVDKNIGVYGHYGYVPSNTFKNYTENEDPTITTPYYSKNGVEGEYRYHGYTLDGIRHTNTSYPVDQASSRKPEEKTWLFHYWDNDKLKKKQDGSISDWNERAINLSDVDTQLWINEGLPFTVTNGNNDSENAYDYANVLTPSSMYSYGKAKLWHRNRDGLWYDTFTLKKRDGRKETPVTLDINILNKGNNRIPIGANQTKILLDVTVTLKDEAYYDDRILKEIYYTRGDLKGFEITIAGETYELPKNGANYYSGRIQIPITRNQVSNDGNYTVSGVAKAVYYQDKRSNGAQDEDHDTMQTIIDVRLEQALISEFMVEGYIYFSDEEPLSPDQFDYVDMSLGNIDEYTIEIRVRDGEYIEHTYAQLDNDTINNLLYSLVGDRREVIADITQTIRSGEETSSCSKRTRVYKTKRKETIKLKENIYLPDKCFDILTYDVVTNNLSDDDISRITVKIDGQEIITPTEDFLNGRYVFGAINNINPSELHFVEVSALSKDDMLTYIQKWVRVYNTRPNLHLDLSGTPKENRKLTIQNTSDSLNDSYLTDRYPTRYTYSITALPGSNMSNANHEKHGENHIFQAREKGLYQIVVTGTNALGRSNTYTRPLVILEDHKPAFNFNIWNNYLARSEQLDMEIGLESVDDDNIINKKITILKDQDKDGIYEQEVLNQSLTDSFNYTPTELGWYRAIITADESFGQDTVTKWLDGTQKRSNEVIRDFFVENLRPLTEVHLDIPFNFPQVDVIIALDKNLSSTTKSQITSKRIAYQNYLRSQGINPVLDMWDMKVYEHSTPASTTRNTGGSYPSSSTTYGSGGYYGTLNRSSVSNSPYTRDEGYSRTVRECHTISQCCHPRWGCHDGGCDCGQSGHSQEGDCGDSSYGTREECTDRREWVSDYVSYDDYTGYYTGTIYKYVRQQPPIQGLRPNADKYILYISESGIHVTSPSEHKNRLSPVKEFSNIINEHDFNITLIGNSAIKSQSSYDQYYDNLNIDTSINRALDMIIGKHPFSSDYLMEVGQSINIETVDLETEGDGLQENGFQYVHNANYYDNPLGTFSYARDNYQEDGEWTSHTPIILDKSGRLSIYRRIKDSISGYEENELYSNIFQTTINIHRKPIARYTLDWEYDLSTRVYKTRWVDTSFDYDHELSHTTKGIIDRKIVYHDITRPLEKYYKIPDDLTPGATYQVEYMVKDLEGVWSNPNVKEYTLPTIPPPQILQAKLKTELTKFNTNSIPASENLILYDALTRFPYEHHLEMAIYKGDTRKTNQVLKQPSQASIEGQNYTWSDTVYNIPATLPDGNYTYKLSAVANNNSGNTAEKNFTIQVITPVDLISRMEEDITYDRETTFTATTSIYVDEVTITLFKDTPHARTRNLIYVRTNGDTKYWSLDYKSDRQYISDGNYIAEYTASTPNGNSEIQQHTYEFKHNTPPTVTIQVTDPPYIYEGDDVWGNISIHDIDLDELQVTIDVSSEGNLLKTINMTSTPNAGVYVPIHTLLHESIAAGSYEMNVKVDDGNGGIAESTYTYVVHPLSIIGQVDHVDQWNTNRIKYNNAYTGTEDAPRSIDTYWSGERFLVSAETTKIHPLSQVKALQVEVKIIEDSTYKMFLASNNLTKWAGEFWDNTMIYRWGRPEAETLTMYFTVWYSNGTIKTDDIQIIIDDRDPYFKYHRKF